MKTLKKANKLICLLLLLYNSQCFAQCNCNLSPSSGSILTEDYTSPGSWVFTDNTAGTMSITAGTMYYNSPAGANYNKASLLVPGLAASSQSFVAEAKVTVNFGNAPAHHIMAFTESDLDPICTDAYAVTNNDGIMVILEKPGTAPSGPACCTDPNDPSEPWVFKLAYKNGTTLTQPATATIGMLNPNPLTTYYVRLVRKNCRVYLAVYSNAAFTTHIPGSPVCIDIPTTVTGFNYLQQGVLTWANPNRTIDMNVDYVKVSPYSGGCTLTNSLSILYGPSNPCPGDLVNLSVIGASGGSTYLWSTGATTSSISVNPLATTTYTVTVTSTFGCTSSVSQTVSVQNCTPPVQFCRYIDDGLANVATKDRGEAVIKTNDGGIALVGTLFQSAADADIYFVKYAADMTAQCSVRLGEEVNGALKNENGFAVMQAIDGYYYVAGTVNVGAGNNDVFVIKIDVNNCANPIVWSQRYGHPAFNESAAQIVQMPLGGNNYDLLVAGSATSVTLTASDILALKISSAGSYIDSRVYFPFGNSTSNENGRDAIKLANLNTYIIVGESTNSGNTNVDAIAIRIGSNLALQSSIIIDGSGRNENAFGVIEDGPYLYTVGRSTHFSADNDLLVMRIQSNLAGPVAAFTYQTTATGKETGYSIKKSAAGKYIIAGSHYESTTTGIDGLIAEITPGSMALNWAKKSLQANYYLSSDEFTDITEIANGNFVVTGYTTLTNNDMEIFVGKFDFLSGSTNECCLVNIPMTGNSYTPSTTAIDQKQIVLSSNVHGLKVPYYLEQHTCTEFSSFRSGAESEEVNANSFKKENLTIYPNPSSGKITFKFDDDQMEIRSIVIYDLSGKSVKEVSLNEKNHKIQLDVSSLETGVYFAAVITNTGQINTKFSIAK